MTISGLPPKSPLGSPSFGKARPASPVQKAAAGALQPTELSHAEQVHAKALAKAIKAKEGKEVTKIFKEVIKGKENWHEIVRASSPTRPEKVAELVKTQLNTEIEEAIQNNEGGKVEELILQLLISNPDLSLDEFRDDLFLEDEQIEFGVEKFKACFEKQPKTGEPFIVSFEKRLESKGSVQKMQQELAVGKDSLQPEEREIALRLSGHLQILTELSEKTALTPSQMLKIALYVEKKQQVLGVDPVYISTKESGLPRALILSKDLFVVLSKHKGQLDTAGAERKVSCATVSPPTETKESFVRIVNLVDSASKGETLKEVERIRKQIALANEINPGDIFLVVEHTSKKGKAKISIIEKMYPKTLSDAKLGVEQKKEVLGQVASAVQRMHDLGYVHADIKRDNVVFDPVAMRAKLIDFGASYANKPNSKISIPRDKELLGKGYGTDKYTSLARLLGNQNGEDEDQFALGCLFYETMHEKEIPWASTIQRRLYGQTVSVDEVRGEIAKSLATLDQEIEECRDPIKKELLEITRGLLEIDPAKRMPISEVTRRLSVGKSE